MKQITTDGVIDITKVKAAQQEGKIAPIVIKGVQWSIFSQEMRDEIRELFTEILLRPNDFEAIKAAYKVKLFRELTMAMESLVAGNRKPVEKFASRVRRSGKSGKCKHLQAVYPEITDNFIFCLPLKRITKQEKVSQLIIPVAAVNESNYRRVDEFAIFDAFESQIKKFFSKETGVKDQRRHLAAEIEEDEIMVRIETATNK